MFLSYVREDSSTIEGIATVLRDFEVNVWMDKTALKPGLRWQGQIRHGISKGDFFIAFFSDAYVNRSKTYMNEELTLAIEELRQRPADRAWFIPVKLNACDIPDRNIGAGETLRSIEWVDLYTDWTAGMEKILSVIVPGSERIPALIQQLGHDSARRRTEAIEALGRLGPLARKAAPTLIARVESESKSVLGLSPLVAIKEALRKMEIVDPSVDATVAAAFVRMAITRSISASGPVVFGPVFLGRLFRQWDVVRLQGQEWNSTASDSTSACSMRCYRSVPSTARYNCRNTPTADVCRCSS